uniref:Uncharacterized protein n=1 Tax=Physcomitrium patens TaxID=3218 RepID=A0A2K1J727_PHYPA|nr:hypothetical protein PHYPA_020430 [Physcomitrium patens]
MIRADLTRGKGLEFYCSLLFYSGDSVAGTRTRVARVRAEYPNHLDYNGCG